MRRNSIQVCGSASTVVVRREDFDIRSTHPCPRDSTPGQGSRRGLPTAGVSGPAATMCGRLDENGVDFSDEMSSDSLRKCCRVEARPTYDRRC